MAMSVGFGSVREVEVVGLRGSEKDTKGMDASRGSMEL